MQKDYRSVLKELLQDTNYIDREQFSKDDFVTTVKILIKKDKNVVLQQGTVY